MRRLFMPFESKPPLLGAILHGLVMAVIGVPIMLGRGPLARQVPLFVLSMVVFTLASYAGRVTAHNRPQGPGDHDRDGKGRR